MELSAAARALVESLQRRPPAERRAFLLEACGATPELWREVEEYLQAVEGEATGLSGGEPEPVSVPQGPGREHPSLSPGDALEAFRIDAVLGQGGFGVVYRALDPHGRPVALKTVRLADARLLQSIRREIHALAALRHPGIVPIVGEGVHDGLPWYAMELLSGRPLAALVPTPGDAQRGPGVVAEALTLLRRLCVPIAYLHGEGLVHRDLKPANVLVRDDDGTPVLIDFGLTAASVGGEGRETLEVAGEAAGTPLYMAPEQAQGELSDPRSDLYSLGCIAFELLTGRPPFLGSAREVLRQHATSDPLRPSHLASDLPPAVDDLVLSLLAKAPRNRPGYAEDVAALLSELGAGDGAYAGAPPPRPYLHRPALAGRDAEIERSSRLRNGARQGRGAMLLVSGESGIGKTRLVAEIARDAQLSGMVVMAGRCPAGGASPLLAFRDALQGIADRCREGGREATRRLLGDRGAVLAPYHPALAGLALRDDAAVSPLPAAAARLRLFRGLWETFAALAANRPLALLLDDLQWADALSLDALHHVLDAGGLEGTHLLVVGSYRTGEAPELLQRLAARPEVVDLPLHPIAADGIARLLADMLSLAAVPEGLSHFLCPRVAGNPLFATEYLRAAIERGLLRRDRRGLWRMAGGEAVAEEVFAGLPIPDTVDGILLQRLSLLSPAARRLLDAAAVVGDEAPAGILAGTAGLADAEALEPMQELVRRQVLRQGEDVSFTHDRLREIAYRELAREARAALHRRAAETFEGSGSDRAAHAAARGRHWEAAGEPGRARPCYLAAAREAAQRHALTEARALYDAYLGLTAIPDGDSVGARLELAEVLRTMGRPEEARHQHLLGIEDALAVDDVLAIARHQQALGVVLVDLGRADEGRSVLEEAIVLFRRAGRRDLAGSAVADLSYADFVLGRLADAEARCHEALAILREERAAGQPRVLQNLAALASARGDKGTARALLDETLRLRVPGEDLHGEATNLANLANLEADEGNVAAAGEIYDRALAVARRIGDLKLQGSLLTNMASLHAEMGRIPEAYEVVREALGILRQAGDRRGQGAALRDLAAHAFLMGRREEAAGRLAESESLLRPIGARPDLAKTLCVRTHLALDEGQPADDSAREAHLLADAIGAGEGSQLRSWLHRMDAARHAAARGEPLLRGHRREDFPPPLLAWLEAWDAEFRG